MKDLFFAFLTVFIAEMGDKTQLLALAFSTKYKMKQVLIGVLLGSFLNHGIAIVFASIIAKYAPISRLKIATALMFITFGLFSLKLDYDDEEETEQRVSPYGPILTVAGAFFLGELGDKTQLAAMTVAIQSSFPFLVLLGTTFAMVAVSLIGIIVGKLLGKKIPEVTMKFVAAGIFLIFGFAGLIANVPAIYQTPMNLTLFLSTVIGIVVFILYRNIQNKNTWYASRITHHLKQCQECEIHRDDCLIGLEINSNAKKYLGQELPYLGRVISYLESINQLSPQKYRHLKKHLRND